ncbi:MAG: HAMP domain-containing protein [Alphaproteobacteria bacterium]|nr:HAMP domain-containing protein [Alphaproteobacteria bacterium]
MHSIRVKILAVTTALLALFAAATGIATYLLDQVVDEIDAIAEEHVPLVARIASIDVLTYELELNLRRSLESDPPDPERREMLLARVAAAAGELRRDFAETNRILALGIADSRNDVADRIALSRIEGSVALLERRLAPFLALAEQVVAALRGGDMALARAHAAGFRVFEDAFDQDIAAVRAAVDELIAGSVRETEAHQLRVLALNGGLFAAATLLGLVLFAMLATRLQRSFATLLAGTRAVEGGQLDVAVPVESRDEIGQLARAFNHMVRQLRDKEQIRDTFGKYLDPRIVARLVEGSAGDATLSERKPATVFFSDIKGFSGMSESLTASAMVHLLNSYFAAVTGEIRARNGIIDKFIGDAVMAFWTTPFSDGDAHASDACLAALAQQRAIEAFRAELPQILGLRRNVPDFVVRMGLASGEVVMGTIGSNITRSYTVIGDIVNSASRLEGANKAYGTSIVIDETTCRLAAQAIEVRELDLLAVAGKSEPIRIYELLGEAGSLAPDMMALAEAFAAGLAAYRRQDWDRAAAHFDECLAIRPDDGPARAFRERTDLLRATPPGPDWDGVWRLSAK